jgi:hypothetical protein
MSVSRTGWSIAPFTGETSAGVPAGAINTGKYPDYFSLSTDYRLGEKSRSIVPSPILYKSTRYTQRHKENPAAPGKSSRFFRHKTRGVKHLFVLKSI